MKATSISKKKSLSKPSEELIKKLDAFCAENGIRHNKNYDSFYFTVEGQEYRVSSHSVDSSIYYNGKHHKVMNHHIDGNTVKNSHEYCSKVKCFYCYPSRLFEVYRCIKLGIQIDNNGRKK